MDFKNMTPEQIALIMKQATEALKDANVDKTRLAQTTRDAGYRAVKEYAEGSGVESAMRDFLEGIDHEALKDASIITSPTSADCGKRGGSTTVKAIVLDGVKLTLSASWADAGSPSVVRRPANGTAQEAESDETAQ